MTDLYLIWSNEHRAWWAPGQCGYVKRVSEAGRYRRDEALDVCRNALGTAGHLGVLAEIPVRLDDMKDFINGAMVPGGVTVSFKTALQIGEEMLAAPKVRMDDGLSKVLINLCMLEASAGGVPEKFKEQFAYKIVDGWMTSRKVAANEYVRAMIACVADRAGSAVLYVAALYALGKKLNRGDKPLDLKAICEFSAFGQGFLAEESLSKIWGGQKVRPQKAGDMDNSVDMPEAWS